MDGMLLALDFGGTKLTAAVKLFGEEIWRAHERVLSPAGADAEGDIQAMFNLAHKLLAGVTPLAIGVSFGGPVNFATGTVRLSHHVPGWENTPLSEMLENEFGAPARVDNDANVAALGEHRYGAGKGFSNLLYITVSTGVGGGWILNGQPWRGWEGMAGEIGHIVVDPTGPLCLCGKHGCVERLASGPYMAQNSRSLMQENPDRGSVLHQICNGDLGSITGEFVSLAASQGDGLAWEVLEKGAWAIGRAVGNTANLINPQRFILGGGVVKSGHRYWEVIRREAHATALPEIHFDIVPAALGDDAPLWGAIALAEDRPVEENGP
jgi:glucokinase